MLGARSVHASVSLCSASSIVTQPSPDWELTRSNMSAANFNARNPSVKRILQVCHGYPLRSFLWQESGASRSSYHLASAQAASATRPAPVRGWGHGARRQWELLCRLDIQRRDVWHSAVQEMKEFQRDDSPDILAEAIEVTFDAFVAQRCICHSAREQRIDLVPFVSQDNIFEWHFVVRGAADTDFEVRRAHAHAPANTTCPVRNCTDGPRPAHALPAAVHGVRPAGWHLSRPHTAAV